MWQFIGGSVRDQYNFDRHRLGKFCDWHEGGCELVVGIGGGCGYSFGDYVLAPVKFTAAIEAGTISLR